MSHKQLYTYMIRIILESWFVQRNQVARSVPLHVRPGPPVAGRPFPPTSISLCQKFIDNRLQTHRHQDRLSTGHRYPLQFILGHQVLEGELQDLTVVTAAVCRRFLLGCCYAPAAHSGHLERMFTVHSKWQQFEFFSINTVP